MRMIMSCLQNKIVMKKKKKSEKKYQCVETVK